VASLDVQAGRVSDLVSAVALLAGRLTDIFIGEVCGACVVGVLWVCSRYGPCSRAGQRKSMYMPPLPRAGMSPPSQSTSARSLRTWCVAVLCAGLSG
jgi:hypothetical protein